jgi:hypothetical protein
MDLRYNHLPTRFQDKLSVERQILDKQSGSDLGSSLGHRTVTPSCVRLTV